MKGRKNRPVPLKIIHSFKKMQEFQPESAVLDALRISKSVNVIKEDGKWCLQRKQPFIKEEATGEKKPKSKKVGSGIGIPNLRGLILPNRHRNLQGLKNGTRILL